ncbi:AMP-binding protein [Pseudonocardia sp. CA-107938]|uniref:AMP-binding protein n=1 Tax=Pseudonocardia sp. CA-107938 TaxID=3240021 RepID=UPI003D8DA3F7
MPDVDDTVERWLSEYGAPDANLATLLCDRHEPDAVAFRFVDADLAGSTMTYGELADRSRRLATALADRGVQRSDRVAVLLSKRPELVVTLLALWRLGAVHVPLFTAFAEGAIRLRVESAGVRLVVTEPEQRAKLAALDGVDVLETGAGFDRLVSDSAPLTASETVGGDGAFLQLYTSGTTGKPKGVVVPVRALAAFHSYLHHGLDVRAEDVYWNAADPGWAYGLYYGIVAPMVGGRANLLFRGAFTPESTAAVMQRFGVTNFAGAPTMYRAMSKAAAGPIPLRRASSAGEPLTPDVVAWGESTFGVPIGDHYGQTELGMVIGNHWHDDVVRPIRAGSMGHPLPGFVAGVVDGQIAVDASASPLFWFGGYQDAPEKTAERFTEAGRWYLTGDTGRVDEDGYFFFTARDDDVILASGYRIGPFDVESVLITHPAVTDVAVVGRPDPEGIRGEIVEAFVVTGAPPEARDGLARELQDLVRDTYSRHAYPRAVHFVDALPKTPSGKIQRFLLRRG